MNSPATALRAAATLGDAQWQQMSAYDDEGIRVPFRPRPDSHWSLVFGTFVFVEKRIGNEFIGWIIRFFGCLLLAPVDVVLALVRLVLLPIVVCLWYLERSVSKWLGYSYFCPICFSRVHDPLVYCSGCGEVQSQLRPLFGSLFMRRCANPSCTKPGRWPILGQYLLAKPKPLVCRDLPEYVGCYRRNHLAEQGKFRFINSIIIGSSVPAKHATLGHVIEHFENAPLPRQRLQPVSDVCKAEREIARQWLVAAFHRDTQALESLGQFHTLARSYLVRSPRRRKIVGLHNVPVQNTRREEDLAEYGVSWNMFNKMVFLMDPKIIAAADPNKSASQAELLARVIRRAEQHYNLVPSQRVPIQLMVVLPFPTNSPLSQKFPNRTNLDATTVSRLVLEADPAFHSLASTVFKRPPQFLGGIVPDQAKPTSGSWIEELANWLTKS